MIRVVFGATAAVLVLAPMAVAQTLPAACAFTPAPPIPDGATATNAAMIGAREALQEWRATRAAELTACKGALDQAHALLNAIETAHNQGVTETDAAIDRFIEENAEYNARVRARRDGATRPDR
ncbi:MAG: hypothetical protein AB7H66_15245 [Hyphomonadaceae bacterium]